MGLAPLVSVKRISSVFVLRLGRQAVRGGNAREEAKFPLYPKVGTK